ncbi:54S ribosomal protein L4, mitochondrial [Golovinomyces cichoracearum]|uniref:Large ribosomal subunit protein uL29m n=1 Tax=Golovinomyces cichoracearum TaxID=62708 RepID=A0A420HCS4_9PEZI|nr:54S ribosomal protein L4, mitochondrial [Golovinomyces cichoracearum]RKF78919.1 54S ribosomal protein L4, mitochondrial [Golovinomyces cichoracearum]
MPPPTITPSAKSIIHGVFHGHQGFSNFITPYYYYTRSQQILEQKSTFTTYSNASYPRDMNRDRGVSTRRRTGLRQPLSVSKTPLPKPVLDPTRHSEYKVSEDHGLWGFFHSREKSINTPQEDNAFGRSWTVEELREKSWEDLHALWWICAKENNRIATASYERKRINAGYGDAESEERDKAVRRTKRAIKQALTERYYAWSEAKELAKSDSEVDLSGNGPAYRPKSFYEENELPETQDDVGGLPPKIETDIQSEKRNLTPY